MNIFSKIKNKQKNDGFGDAPSLGKNEKMKMIKIEDVGYEIWIKLIYKMYNW